VAIEAFDWFIYLGWIPVVAFIVAVVALGFFYPYEEDGPCSIAEGDSWAD